MDAVVIAHAQVLLGHKILILDAVVIAHAQVLELWLECCYHDDLQALPAHGWLLSLVSLFSLFRLLKIVL